MIRKTLLPFIALMLIFIKPSFAQSPPPGGWKWDNARVTVEKDMQRIRLGVEAQKTYPVAIVDPKTNKITQNVLKAQKSAIKIAPTANKVGKSLIKRAPNIAITNAVIALLGKSVDWVMDAENNRIKYKDGESSPEVGKWTKEYYEIVNAGTVTRCYPASNCIPALKAANPTRNYTHCTEYAYPNLYATCYYPWGSGTNSETIFRVPNPDYDPSASSPDASWQYIPINTVAEKIIDQAGEGQAPAMQVMSDTALDMLEAGELDSALEAAAEPKQYGENEYPPDAVPSPNPNPDGENPTDPENPNPNPNPEPTPWPAFCDWATKMCDLADWIMDDEPLPEEETQIPEQDIELRDPESFDKPYISAPSQCPPDVEKNIPIGSNSFNFVIPMTPVCDFGANVISPVLYFIALLQAAFIIGSAFKVG